MNITKSAIVVAAKLDACPEALAWLRAEPRTMEQLVEKNHEWARWIIYYAPEPWSARACAALLPRADNFDLREIIARAPAPWPARAAEALLPRAENYDLRMIMLWAPAPWPGKAKAALARQEK